jgi:hypothetical protein
VFKKLICSLGIAVILSSAIISPASAETCFQCGATSGHTYSCSGIQSNNTADTPCWCRGQNVDGYYHTTDCVILKWYYYTAQTCSFCGSYQVNQYNTHLHLSQHTSSFKEYQNCPY